MAFDPHPVDEADVAAFSRVLESAFGNVAADDDLSHAADVFDPSFAIGIADGGHLVATASAYPFELTLPARPGAERRAVNVPGVTAVGVLPTHRRRGLLTKMMDYQLADYRQRGFPLAILTASESIIYGRYGYGLAQSYQSVVIESRRSAFGQEAPAAGRFRMVDRDEAGKLCPGIHDRARWRRPGEIDRSAKWWLWHLKDEVKRRDGGACRFYAIHESPDGEADGWVSYRYHERWPEGIPRHRVEIDDLVATDDQVESALWRFVLDLDLVEEVSARLRPVDDPLRWLLAEPQRLRTTELGDHVWVRIIDISAALSARGYGTDDELVLEVTGPVAGRFVLETGSGACRRATKGEKGHLVLGLAELGAIYLGALRPSTLAAAGRVTETEPGALARADAAFVSPIAPFCSIGF